MNTLSRRALLLLMLFTSVLSWVAGAAGQAAPNAAAASQDRPPASASTIGLEFVPIQPGVFRMGCSEGDKECDADENPAHEVHITRTFQIGKHEVTQAQWQAVMGSNRSRFKGDTLPVDNVSWNDVQQFLEQLNSRKDGFRYRLPTEAEWEYAARAGTSGPNTGPVDQVAWYQQNAGATSHPVGLKRPNAWGLYDMEGNVYEWTQDWFFDYESDPITDPTGPEMGYERVPRGGSWESTTKGVRTSNRNMAEPGLRNYNIGFRCVRVPGS